MAEIRKILDDMFDAFTLVSNGNYVSLHDIKGAMSRYTPAAADLFGLPGEYIPDGVFSWSEYVHPEDRDRYEMVMGSLLAGEHQTYNLAYRVRLGDGDYALFRSMGAVISDEYGVPELIGGVMVNEGQIEHTDPVTVLRNQYGFFTDLSAVLEKKRSSVILLIGISHMSAVNEKNGYGFGNRLLQQAGWVIQECAGQEGIVYRMDGAKFAVLSDQLTPAQMEEIYVKIRQRLLGGIMVGEVKQTVFAAGGMLSTAQSRLEAQTIYTCLKYACRESKKRRRGELVNFDGSTGGAAPRTASAQRSSDGSGEWNTLEMIDEIRSCVVHDWRGFSLEYQPVFDGERETAIGVEALLRWHSEKYQAVAPAEYVPVLERDVVFEELGYWILRQAMSDGVRFLEKNPDFIVGVNIASVQLENEHFSDELEELSAETGFPLSNLSLELTKDCRQLELGFLKEIVSALQKKGVRFIIDDFGSGVASIDFLRELSSDYIKFDMKYIREIETNEEDQQIILHMSELARACGTQVCVKGIETEGIRDIIRGCAVGVVQGFYFARPMSPDEIVEKVF